MIFSFKIQLNHEPLYPRENVFYEFDKSLINKLS